MENGIRKNIFRILLIQLMMFQYLVFRPSLGATIGMGTHDTVWGAVVFILLAMHIFGVFDKDFNEKGES